MITEDNISYLAQLADELDTAQRCGGPDDEPEGARFIIMSDTLARKIAKRLRRLLKDELPNKLH